MLADKPTRPESRYLAAFKMNEGHTLNGHNPALHHLRREAMAAFEAQGLPGRKDEAWKYTNAEKLFRADYALALKPEAAPPGFDAGAHGLPGLDAHVAVIVNGRFDAERSRLEGLPEGVVVSGLARAAEEHAALVEAHLGRYADVRREAVVALNTAFVQDGLFVYVPRGVQVERPLLVLVLRAGAEPVLVQPRLLVVVEQGAALTLVQRQRSAATAPTLLNAVAEFFVGDAARLDHYLLQEDDAHASTVTTAEVVQGRDSFFSTVTVTFSGATVRNNLHVRLAAENAEAHLLGLFLGTDHMHVDNHTLVDHAKPRCNSNELYKGVLDGAATGVFNGKVYVAQDAQQTNAYQSNKALVLTAQASMYSKPELEIYADDVKCSHGATTGQLDPEALFYLRARGLTAAQARALLLLAFARDVVERVALAPLRDYLDACLLERFGKTA